MGLVILVPVFSASTAEAHKVARKPAAVPTYSAPSGVALVLPNGKDNPNAAPRIVACNPNNATGTIQTTLELGSPGLTSNAGSLSNFNVYTINFSSRTQIWISGDAGKPYLARPQSLCPLKEYDPEGNNETTFKDLESVAFTFPQSRHTIKRAQQFFQTASPTKVTFYVSGDTNH